MEKYLEKFGSNFLVAALVPSLTFVLACIISFAPLFYQPFDAVHLLQIPQTISEIWNYGIIILFIGIILSFTLSSLNTFMLKVLEGYVFFDHFPMFQNRERKRERKIRRKLEQINRKKSKIDDLYEKCTNDKLKVRLKIRLNLLSQEMKSLATDHQLQFPYRTEILPTRFGNILKASEFYSNDRYGIDSVPLWPRLIHVIDKKYLDYIDQSNNELSFLVNCMFLSLGYSLISLPIGLFLIVTQAMNSWMYILLGFVGLITAYIFHRASIFSVCQYGDMIRSAYDLFRFKLVESLGFSKPKDLESEQEQWKAICEFMNVGDYMGPVNFEYNFQQDDQK